ncbi:MAG: hypothetical protein H6625_04560 [Bdellovibrionaceae bacterium]|nr:hypothetical protein [Pseudobdellovibrionaceae bacterium]
MDVKSIKLKMSVANIRQKIKEAAEMGVNNTYLTTEPEVATEIQSILIKNGFLAQYQPLFSATGMAVFYVSWPKIILH